MLYLVGLGLGDEKDITVKGLEVVRQCEKVYLEHYTSILTVGKDALERYDPCSSTEEVAMLLDLGVADH